MNQTLPTEGILTMSSHKLSSKIQAICTGDSDMEGSCVGRQGIFYPNCVVSCVTFLGVVYRQRNLCVRFSKFISEKSFIYWIRKYRGLVNIFFNFSYFDMIVNIYYCHVVPNQFSIILRLKRA